MTFEWPWAFLFLPVIAAAAMWVLFRPRRPRRTVGSLWLWRDALASLGRRGRRRSLSATAGWLAVLAGCVSAAMALAQPTWRASRPARHVSIVLAATAELGPDGPGTLSRAVGRLLDRLDAADRVRLIQPIAAGASEAWLSVGQARREIEGVRVLPARWEELAFPPPDAGSQIVVAFIPAQWDKSPDFADVTVEAPCELPPVTIDQFGARRLTDGRVGVLVTVRNNTDSGWSGPVKIGAGDRPAEGMTLVTTMDVPPGETSTRTVEVPDEGFLTARVESSVPGAIGTAAYLAFRPGKRRAVAMIGRDDPLVRRFLSADPSVTLTGDVDRADLVVAIGTESPKGKPALLIEPPEVSPPATPATPIEEALLSSANVAADDDVMRGVDLSGIAARRLTGWTVPVTAGWDSVVTLDGRTIIMHTRRDLLSTPQDARVAVAMDLATENTNWTTTESFVFFMANAIRWLDPSDDGDGEYVSSTPLAEGLIDPGFHQDPAGRWRAVSLTGLRGGQPRTPPAEQIARIELPAPRMAAAGRALWSPLAVAAMAMLMLGWFLHAREG